MKKFLVTKLQLAEAALGFQIPEDVFEFIATLRKPEKKFGEEKWIFGSLKDNKKDPADNYIISSSKDFKEHWGIDALVFADNGIGDYLLLLPDKEGDKLRETIFVMLHESAEIKIFATDIINLQLWGPNNYFWSDDYYLRLDEGKLAEGREADENYDATVKEELFGKGYNKRSQIDDWIDEERTDLASEIVVGLLELVEEGDHKTWALNKLSDIYLRGFGPLSQNLEKAMEYNQEAMDMGSCLAYSNRAIAYFAGIAVEKDLDKALKLAKKADKLSKDTFADPYPNKKKGLYNDLVKIIEMEIKKQKNH